MFCTIRARRGGLGPGRVAAAPLLGLAALAVSSLAGEAQEQGKQGGNILQQGDHVLKQGAKLLGFATDLDPPADFVTKSRPGHDLDFIPLFQPPPEPERKALKPDELKAMKSELDSVQKQHDALRQVHPPAAKAPAEQEAAKKKPQTSTPNAQQ
jgi:hypothetical protein